MSGGVYLTMIERRLRQTVKDVRVKEVVETEVLRS